MLGVEREGGEDKIYTGGERQADRSSPIGPDNSRYCPLIGGHLHQTLKSLDQILAQRDEQAKYPYRYFVPSSVLYDLKGKNAI